MLNIDKIIDAELYHVRNIGCIISITDEEYEEEEVDRFNIPLKND